MLNVQNVVIERAHHTELKKDGTPRQTVLLDYRHKIKILKNANKLKNSDIFISEDFAKESREKIKAMDRGQRMEAKMEECYITMTVW